MQTIDLFVPGLLNLPAHELNARALAERAPSLHKVLRFAQRKPCAGYDIDDLLIQRLQLGQKALPYVHATVGERQSAMLFRPIHLKSDLNNAFVFPVSDSDEDIDILISDLKDYFKVDFDIESLPGRVWLMRLNQGDPVQGVPHYLTAMGKKITHYLEQARANLNWFKLLNEMQMFLYQHDINQKRFLSGLPMINSLWCWGADDYRGEFLDGVQWFSDDPLMRAIGSLYCAQSAEVKDIREMQRNKDVIVVNLEILRALKGEGDADIRHLLDVLEAAYLQPLMNRAGYQLVVHTGREFDLRYRPSMTWKWWKKSEYNLGA